MRVYEVLGQYVLVVDSRPKFIMSWNFERLGSGQEIPKTSLAFMSLYLEEEYC